MYTMAVPPNLLPSHREKTLGAMKAERTVKRITFNPSEANPGGNPVRQRAQACGERGHRRGLARPRVQHQPQSHRRSRKQLSRAKRVPGPG